MIIISNNEIQNISPLANLSTLINLQTLYLSLLLEYKYFFIY